MDGNYLERRTIRRIALVTNPKAGKGRASAAADEAQRHFRARGIDVVGIAASTVDGMRKLIRKALSEPGLDAIVACGGDGLINQVVQEQAERDLPLGIFPAGTGNDLAREFGIPTRVSKAVKIIADGFATRCDIGKLTQENTGESNYFATIACSGFDNICNERTNSIKWPTGEARYLLATFIELINYKPFPATIDVDGKRVFDDDVVLCAAGITRTYGAGMYVCPDADHYDGLFDLTIVGALNRRQFLMQMGKLIDGEHDGLLRCSTSAARKSASISKAWTPGPTAISSSPTQPCWKSCRRAASTWFPAHKMMLR